MPDGQRVRQRKLGDAVGQSPSSSADDYRECPDAVLATLSQQSPYQNATLSALPTLASLLPGNHLCCIYETDEEHRITVTSFISLGLERNEKVVYIVDARSAEKILEYLRDDGLDVESRLRSGQLSIITRDDAYLRDGVFEPEAMIALLDREIENAIAEGYSALRVTGEMTWALRGLPGSDRLIEYEARLNEFLHGAPCTAICQYDRRRFPASVLLEVLRTHPVAIIGTEICDNSYYVPPEEVLDGDPAETTLRHWLANLVNRRQADEAQRQAGQQLERRIAERSAELATANNDLRQEIEERRKTARALKTSEATFAAVFESAPVMMMLLDEDRIVRAANPAASEMLSSWSPDWADGRFGHAVRCIHSSDSPKGCGFGPECDSCPVRRLVDQTFQAGRTCRGQEVRFTRTVGDEWQDVYLSISTSLPDLVEKQGVLVCVEDITERKQAEKELETNLFIQEALRSILQISLKPISLEETLNQTLDVLFSVPFMSLESKGAVFLAMNHGDELILTAQRGLPRGLCETCRSVPIGRCLCGRAAAGRKIVFAERIDERHEIRYPGIAPHGHYCVPILSGDDVLGVMGLYVKEGHCRQQVEELFLVSVADTLASGIKRRRAEESLREKEVQLLAARAIQEHLLPQGPPDVPGFDIAGALRPAEFAAGDYFDYIALPGKLVGFVIADVSGHGFPSALVMASTQAFLRSVAQTQVNISEILSRTNRFLNEELESDRFVTLLLASLDPETGWFVYSNAGHPPGYVLDATGALKARLESQSPPLAILPEGRFPLGNPFTLVPGDVVVLYTDGVFEARSADDEFFGTERILQIVRNNLKKSAAEIIDRLHEAVREFTPRGELLDDVTAMVVKVGSKNQIDTAR